MSVAHYLLYMIVTAGALMRFTEWYNSRTPRTGEYGTPLTWCLTTLLALVGGICVHTAANPDLPITFTNRPVNSPASEARYSAWTHYPNNPNVPFYRKHYYPGYTYSGPQLPQPQPTVPAYFIGSRQVYYPLPGAYPLAPPPPRR